jgi:hypothetical protein
MTTIETEDLGEKKAPKDFQVPRLLRHAEVLGTDGRLLRGRVFLPAAAQSHAGAMRAEEWMNDPAAFFPFLPDGEGTPVILNKDRLVVVTVQASADQDQTLDQVATPMRRVAVDCGAVRLEGEVVIDMPANHSRVLDVLNRPGAFLALRSGDVHHLVRKSRITRVREVPDRPDRS